MFQLCFSLQLIANIFRLVIGYGIEAKSIDIRDRAVFGTCLFYIGFDVRPACSYIIFTPFIFNRIAARRRKMLFFHHIQSPALSHYFHKVLVVEHSTKLRMCCILTATKERSPVSLPRGKRSWTR